jgi:hypothetical protein
MSPVLGIFADGKDYGMESLLLSRLIERPLTPLLGLTCRLIIDIPTHGSGSGPNCSTASNAMTGDSTKSGTSTRSDRPTAENPLLLLGHACTPSDQSYHNADHNKYPSYLHFMPPS